MPSSSKIIEAQQKYYDTYTGDLATGPNVKSQDQPRNFSDSLTQEETLATAKVVNNATSTSVILHIETPQFDTEISERGESSLGSPKDIDWILKDQKQMSGEQESRTDVDESISIQIEMDESF